MILLTMIFLHIVDDYYLQGILAQMKQKKFWKEQAPDEMYKYDYIWALIMHAFSWTFMVMLPLMFVTPITTAFYWVFFMNMAFHAIIDDLKANRHLINLWQDQIFHIFQICTIFIILT